jgi:hypothetical protein
VSRYTSSDGLMSSSDPAHVAVWESIVARQEDAKASWADRLRALGVKFAAPDDGWVRRDLDGTGYASVSWYPLFDDRPEVGDLIAFGSPPRGAYGVDHYVPNVEDHERAHRGRFIIPKGQPESACQGYRLARVTEVERGGRLIPYTHYHYEDTGLRVPPPPGRRRLLSLFRRTPAPQSPEQPHG